MKTKIGILVLALCTSFFNVQAQQRTYTTTRATSYDISDNLDLDAVSSIFGESKDLEDFEYRLNDPDNRISNLDLNEDGYIDYLRVIETTNDRNSLIVIQAVLDENIFQDVATIEIERVPDGRHRIQIVGDPWIYGPDYIIEPIFYRPPFIFSFFWGPRYVVWHSPYYWGYYPRWYYHCKPYPTFRYNRHISVFIDHRHTYHRTTERHIHFSGDNYNRIRRNDFAERHPDRSYENRHRESSRPERQIQQQRQPSRSYDIQPNRRIDRNNDNSRREMEKSRENRDRRPVYQERQREPQQREIQKNREYNRREYNSNQEQKRNQTYERRTEQQSRPSVIKEKPSRRVETQQRSSAPRERSGSVQNRSRSNSEPRNVQKSEPAKKEQKKESRERRREE